jgi:hypothetical protein
MDGGGGHIDFGDDLTDISIRFESCTFTNQKLKRALDDGGGSISGAGFSVYACRGCLTTRVEIVYGRRARLAGGS